MKFFKKSHDGGEDSGVTGFWLVEWKNGFSLVFLKFSNGSREAFHSHAFNARTWWLWGEVEEEHLDGTKKTWKPSLRSKFTPKECFHRIISKGTSFAFSVRGPWATTWKEYKNEEFITLTHGRKRVS